MRRFIGLCVVGVLLAFTRANSAENNPRATRILRGLESKFYVAGTPRTSYMLAERMRLYRVPAVSIAVIDNYRVAWVYATGRSDVASNVAAMPGTLFQAASMSKPVAAAAILRLFEEKNLRLDADVNTMLRSWRVPPSPGNSSERVTLRRLLSHTAGTNVPGFAGYDRDAPLPTLIQVLDGAPPANSEAVRVTAIPGRITEYSGGGTSIAEQLAVDLSDEPFAAFMQQTLLQPLGMTSSTFAQPLPKLLWTRAAGGYYSDGTPVHRGWHVYPTMAAAGLWATTSDLATFVIAIQNALRGQGKPPIDATVAHEMTTEVSHGFGLGPQVGSGYFSHNGANEGFRGSFIGLSDAGKGVVVMTNSDNGLHIADEVVSSVAKAYDWPVLQPQPKTAIRLTAAAIAKVAGQYAAAFAGKKLIADVTTDQDAGAPALLLHSPFDAGVAQRIYADAPLHFFTLSGVSLTFAGSEGGKATSFQIGDMKFERLRNKAS